MGGLQAGRLALSAFVALLLGACGGGGGGGGGMLPPPPATPLTRPPPLALPPLPPAAPTLGRVNLSSSEYLANWGPGGIKAPAAWQFQNGHGEGVLIGVLDDGIDPTHPELVGRVDTVNSRDIVQISPGVDRNQLTSTLSHGSELSSLMVGNFNGNQTVGVAYEATVLAVRADNGAGGFFNDDLANAINYAVSKDVDVINLSLGSANPPNTTLRNAIANATAAGTIVVVSAGNCGQVSATCPTAATDPNYPGLLATDNSISHGLILVAGGLNSDGSFNTISNPAGSAASSYLTAPGWEIVVPDYGPAGPVFGYQRCSDTLATSGPCASNMVIIQGTSYASPHVTAAAAVVMSAFPGLTPAEVVQVILQSTDDTGPTGIDNQTGWGRLNLERAFAPIGTVAAPLSSGDVTSMSMLGAVGPAFGDGVTQNAAAWSVTGFDSFGRPYAINLANNWSNAASGPSVVAQAPMLWRSARDENGMRMQMAFAESVAPETMRLPIDRAELEQPAMRIDADLGLGLTATIAAHGARADTQYDRGSSHLDMVNADLSLSLTRQLGDHVSLSFISESGRVQSGLPFTPSSGREAIATRASFALGGAGLDLTMGQLSEESGVLGLVWSRELGSTPGGETQFAGFGAHVEPMPGLRLSASAEYGVADLGASGWLHVIEPLRTSAFALEARANMTPHWLDGQGALTLSLSQPLRVEDGVMAFMAPTSDAYGRAHLAYEQRAFSPTPSGRELRLGLGYSYWAGETLSAFGEAIYVSEPGHVADAEPDTLLRVGLRVAH